MRRDEVFRFVSLRTRYGFAGIMQLFLHAAIGSAFRDDAGPGPGNPPAFASYLTVRT